MTDWFTESYPWAAGHKGGDTSEAAASAMNEHLGRLQQMALDAIITAGSTGLTSHELATVLGVERTTIQPRTSELLKRGRIHDSGLRRPNPNGKKAKVWVAGA